jgi:hypothetical protein
MYRRIIALTLLACAGCVTEAGHIRPTVLPTGKPGYVITCNSNRYEPADAMPGVGNNESILVSCD